MYNIDGRNGIFLSHSLFKELKKVHMSSIELKSKVLHELESVDDYVLEEILNLIQIETSTGNLIKIPSHYEAALNNSITQMESGQTIPNSIVEEKIEQWLYK